MSKLAIFILCLGILSIAVQTAYLSNPNYGGSLNISCNGKCVLERNHTQLVLVNCAIKHLEWQDNAISFIADDIGLVGVKLPKITNITVYVNGTVYERVTGNVDVIDVDKNKAIEIKWE